jgi:hypothetical protein
VKWFKHYAKAHEDRAIEKLIIEYGIAGYGLYMYCLEIIAGSVEPDNLTFELEPDATILARRLSMDTLLVERIMHSCIEMGLFDIAENGRLTCFKLTKYIDQNMTSNPQIREILRKAPKPEITSQSQVNHKPITPTCDQIRLDKIRREEKREEREESEANASPPPPPVRIGNDGTSRFERAKTAGAVIFSPVRKNFIHLRDDERREVLATFTYYSDDEIAAAIKTYAEMLKDDQYDIFAPYASLIGFLRSGVEKYVDEAKPWDVFKKRSAAEASQEKIDWEKIREDLRAKEAERDK